MVPSLRSKAHNLIAHAAASSRSKPQPAPINQTALATGINQTINSSSLEIATSIIDLTDSKSYGYGLSTTPYLAASTTKVLTACLYLLDVQQGTTTLSQTINGHTAQYELQQMIVVSDDNAWAAFNDSLTHPALLAYAQSLGLTSYDPDQNTITTHDLASLLAQLYQHKLLNTQNTQLLLSYMQAADYQNFIGSSIPAGVQFYHKAGFLVDREMDAAVIDNGKHPYVLVIYTKDPSGVSYNQAAGTQAFNAITAQTLATFGA